MTNSITKNNVNQSKTYPYSEIFVLTGSSGSGKSTAARILAGMGAEIVSADEIARQVVSKDSEGLSHLIEQIGSEYLNLDHTLNRKKLHQAIVHDISIKNIVESTLHPVIREEAKKQFIRKIESGSTVIIYDCPLFFEKKLNELGFKKSILITAPTAVLLSRIVERDKISESEAERRIGLQMDQEEKIKLADMLIENNGTLEDLEAKLRILFDQLQKS